MPNGNGTSEPATAEEIADFPHPNLNHPADEADLVDLIPEFAMTPEAQRKLLVDNPARLYGFV